MAELFQTTQQNISQHIQNVYEEGELEPESTHKKFLSVRREGSRQVRRNLDFFNLDMIISVGYRVKSSVATRFRIWATQRLKEYIVKGFTMDDERLKENAGGRYFEELLARIRDSSKQYINFIEPHGLIHEGPASEKVLFYKRIKDVEKRMNEPSIILNSFILSWTRYPQLKWDDSQAELESKHVLFMTDDLDRYIDKLFTRLQGAMK